MVEAFHALVLQYPEVQKIVRGRTIVFGKNSGVSISGQIILYSGEVRNNWLNVIKTTPDSDKLLLSLPMWQKTLSQSLRDIQIVTDPANIVMVGDHRIGLRQLVTSLGDYKTRRSLPSSWPEDMSYFKLGIESDASALMISPEGVFIIPASTPGFLIVDFISKGWALQQNICKMIICFQYPRHVRGYAENVRSSQHGGGRGFSCVCLHQ